MKGLIKRRTFFFVAADIQGAGMEGAGDVGVWVTSSDWNGTAQ